MNNQSAPDYKGTYNRYYDQISGEVNKYVDELIGFAKGDYDFAAKWIENNYKLALGSDDRASAAFLKNVANSLEDKVGRIAFDYQTNSYRAQYDDKTNLSRAIRNKELALSRLAEDETTFKKQFDESAQTAREEQNASLNQRGILTTPRDQATGLAGKEINQLEGQLGDQFSAFQRALARNQQDVNLASGDQVFDLKEGALRGQQDRDIVLRRESLEAGSGRTYNLETAQRQLEKQRLSAEQQRRSLLNQAKPYADYLTRGAYGL